ncbi:glycoside hydrolase family 65 protein [Lacticaseibacillus absianus]|uniref:glycoside hydrolase family 65 protein n=1 Tax=Lacticaseibacillus absianus TaxID=2729623 RepID=UPI0015C94F59|nr:glycoside hydrolase family 65 protein [Lacticaseibacillus absianus]
MQKINDLFSFDDRNGQGLAENHFGVAHQRKFESVFAQGNGYLGLRAAHEETYPMQTRGMFVAGTFETAGRTEIAELPNMPDVLATIVALDGEVLDLRSLPFRDYQRRLNLANGELTRELVVTCGSREYRLAFRRFVSMTQKHLIVNTITITAAQAGEATVQTTIDGTQSNHGAQHFQEGQKRVDADGGISYQYQSIDGSLDAVVYQVQTQSTAPTKTQVTFPRRRIDHTTTVALMADEPVVLSVYSVIVTSRDRDLVYRDPQSLLDKATQIGQLAARRGADELLAQSTKAWETTVWAGMPVTIDSREPIDQLLLNFGRYHLHVMTAVDDDEVNIAAKGLSGEGYRGHTFWDTEIFMLPYFQYQYPAIARHLIQYRVKQLPAARRNAAKNGYQGAQYPWESTTVDAGDATPQWGAIDIDTGNPTRIWTGEIEAHVTADVAYAVKQYSDSLSETDDFFQTTGAFVLIDTARFWASRVTWQEAHQRFEIHDVIGPNEYKEHIDNNAYTNYMAAMNMQLGLAAIEALEAEPTAFATIAAQYDLPGLKATLEHVLAHFYLPTLNDRDILPENDTFLTLKPIDLTPYRGRSVGSIEQAFSMSSINQYQLCKQADVVLVMLMFAARFTRADRLRNLDFYEAKTMHDSSLSYGSHAVACARNRERERAYQFYHQAGLVDLGADPHGSEDGIHAAAMAQLWNAVVQGFGGVSQIDRCLNIDPHLPAQWRALTFDLHWQGVRLTVRATPTSVHISGAVAAPLAMQVAGQTVEFTGDLRVTLD